MPDWIIPANKSTTTTPDWIVQPKSTSLATTYTKPPEAIDFSKKGTHEDFNQAYLGSAKAPSAGGSFVGGEGGSWVANEPDPVADAEWNKANPNAKYVKDTSQWVGGEGGSMQATKEVDWASLPNQGNTKYGRIGEGAMPIKNLDRVIDKRYVYFDPAYGWVTPGQNIEQSKGNKIGLTIAKIGIGALASFAAPGLIVTGLKGAIGAAPSLASGNWQNAALGMVTSGLGYGANALDIPSWVIPAAKTGYSLSKMGKG